MQYDDFIKLIEKLLGIHLALWYVFKDYWKMVHKTTQK